MPDRGANRSATFGVIAVAFVANLVGDWFIFKPRSIVVLTILEAIAFFLFYALFIDRTPQV